MYTTLEEQKKVGNEKREKFPEENALISSIHDSKIESQARSKQKVQAKQKKGNIRLHFASRFVQEKEFTRIAPAK